MSQTRSSNSAGRSSKIKVKANSTSRPNTSNSYHPPDDSIGLKISISSLRFPSNDPQATPRAQRARIASPSASATVHPPTLRHSGSSATTHALETPPRTPTSFDEVEIVAAPVAGVETMDALVDGMNRFDSEDLFAISSIQRHEIKTKRRSKNVYRPNFLYHPPLPTPPPGISLQTTTLPRCLDQNTSRIPRPKRRSHNSQMMASSTANSMILGYDQQFIAESCTGSKLSSEDTVLRLSGQKDTVDKANLYSFPSNTVSGKQNGAPSRPIIPSISEIIKAHASPSFVVGRRSEFGNDSDELISRSSIDTIAEEVQHTLSQPLPESLVSRDSEMVHPRSPPSIVEVSLHSTGPNFDPSPSSATPPSPYMYGYSHGPVSQSESIATYLRSTRLTTLVKIPRPLQSPLTVSLSDLGDPNGRPLVVFLGLGSVRYLMGLYDEMAEILGLRLITIDRWGLGRTSIDDTGSKGIKEWAKVVAEVLDRLGLEHCSIMAHSAGAPYALSFANLRPERVKGDICLLAPWVGGGESAGYKWLKYIPAGVLKTAQAAEWRLQTWMLGKPPTMHYRGIGYDRATAIPPPIGHHSLPPENAFSISRASTDQSFDAKSGHGSFRSSDYDDLADFEGHFESHNTLAGTGTLPRQDRENATTDTSMLNGVRKPRTSRRIFHGILGRTSSLVGNQKDHSLPSMPRAPKPPKVRSLRSIGSLRGSSKSGVASSVTSQSPTITGHGALPNIDLRLTEFEWPSIAGSPSELEHNNSCSRHTRSARPRRSVSLTTSPLSGSQSYGIEKCSSNKNGSPSLGRSKTKVPSLANGTVGYQGALANALIAASHAESSKGVHADLVQILNRENKSWGFSYSSYPHNVRVWYGDKDERIAEHAVRWMEKSMQPGRCEVKMIQGADHALMYRSAVVVEVLEIIRSFWL